MMNIEPREKTKMAMLQASDIQERLYVTAGTGNEIWVSTAYNRILVGVVNGEIYDLVDGRLVPRDQQVGVMGPMTGGQNGGG